MVPSQFTQWNTLIVQLDLTQLNMLSTNDPDFKNQVLQLLLVQTTEIEEALRNGKNKADWSIVAEAAHKYKSAVNLVNQQAFLHFTDLEKMVHSSNDVTLLENMTEKGIIFCIKLAESLREELAG